MSVVSPWWSVVLAAGALLGVWLVGNKRRAGWLVNLGCQVLWITYAVATRQWGFLVSAAIFTGVNARNYVKWRREDRVASALACERVGKARV